MTLALTEEQGAAPVTAADFIDREVVPHRAALGPRRVGRPRDHEAGSGELGFLGLTLPEEYGGPRGDSLSYCLMMEELGRGDSADPGHRERVPRPGRQVRSTRTAPRSSSKQWLPGIASGEPLGCFGLTEPGTGSDAGNLTTRAARDGDDWLLDRRRRCSSPTAPGPRSRWSSPAPAATGRAG